jgi:hypothetical protein
MKIAVVTVEVRTGHSPKDSEALPFKVTFWGGCVHATHNERTAYVYKFSLGVFGFIKHRTKVLPMFITFLWGVVFMTHTTKELPMFITFLWGFMFMTHTTKKLPMFIIFIGGLCS